MHAKKVMLYDSERGIVIYPCTNIYIYCKQLQHRLIYILLSGSDWLTLMLLYLEILGSCAEVVAIYEIINI